MELKDVVKKLVGEIDPVGETYRDEKRLENLKTMCALVDSLVTDIWHVAQNKDRCEYSMKQAGVYAEKFLKSTLNIVE